MYVCMYVCMYITFDYCACWLTLTFVIDFVIQFNQQNQCLYTRKNRFYWLNWLSNMVLQRYWQRVQQRSHKNQLNQLNILQQRESLCNIVAIKFILATIAMDRNQSASQCPEATSRVTTYNHPQKFLSHPIRGTKVPSKVRAKGVAGGGRRRTITSTGKKCFNRSLPNSSREWKKKGTVLAAVQHRFK